MLLDVEFQVNFIFFIILEMSFYRLLFCIASDKNCALILIVILLYRIYLVFCLVAFTFFFISSFEKFCMYPTCVCWESQIYRFIVFITFGKF